MNIENIDNRKGTIQLIDAKNFDYELIGNTKYYYKDDILVSYNNDLNLDNSITIVRIARDFDFIIKEAEINGWILRNSSNHVVRNGANKVNSEFNTDSYEKKILVEYLRLISLISYELTSNEEEKLKNDLKVLYECIKDNNKSLIVVIKENILNVLDFI